MASGFPGLPDWLAVLACRKVLTSLMPLNRLYLWITTEYEVQGRTHRHRYLTRCMRHPAPSLLSVINISVQLLAFLPSFASFSSAVVFTSSSHYVLSRNLLVTPRTDVLLLPELPQVDLLVVFPVPPLSSPGGAPCLRR